MRLSRCVLQRTRRAVAVALAPSTSVAVVGSTGVADAAVGFCSLASHDYYIVYVQKDINNVVGNFFDDVRGDAYARDLDVCIGGSPGNGGTFVLPANVQQKANVGPSIFQGGFGKRATDTSIKFYYANQQPDSIVITSVAPIVGHRYRFDISRDSSGHPDFHFTDVSTATLIWSNTSTTTSWVSTFDLTWYGYETWDSFSHHGPNLPGAGTNMAYMGYSTDFNTAISYRTGMTVGGDVLKQGHWADVDNNHTTVLTIGTWVYGGDQFDSEVQP